MKKFLMIAFIILFSGSAYAGSCPMMAKQIDEKIIYITKTGNEYSHDSMVEDEE